MDIIKYVIIMLLAASFRNGMNTDMIPYKQQIDYIYDYVFEIIEEGDYDIHPAFILAVIETESTYKWQAKNGDHYGLMQINPKWHHDRMKKLGVSDLQANPYDNIRVGVDYISDLFEQYDNPYDVLNVYNSGSTDGYAHEYSITVMERFHRIEHELWDSMEGW